MHPRRRGARLAAATAALALGSLIPAAAAHAADLQANTATFGSVFNAAQPGDVIHLAPGDYGTFNGGSKAGTVTIDGGGGAARLYANLGASQNLVLDGVTVNGLSLNGARNVTIRNSTFTAATVIQTPTSVPNANIVIDHDTFSAINVCSTCYEGRLTVRGYDNDVPVGVTISNSLFGPGGDSDGIQIVGNAYGVQVGPGNEFRGLAQVSAAHTDAVQLYGSSHTLITGNWMHDNATGIMAPDGSDHETITNNVIQTTGYPWPIVMGAATGNTVTHNTLPGAQGTVEVDKSNSGATSSGNLVKDNVVTSVVNATGGSPQGTTADYNLIANGTIGSHDIKAKPVYAGGSSPTSWAGFALAPNAIGNGMASDGMATGIVPGAGGTPSPAPASTTTPTTAPAAPLTARSAGSSPKVAVKRSKSQLRFKAKLRFAILVRPDDAAVDRVSFMIDGRWVSTDRTDPFALAWKVPRGTRYGRHVLTVKAFATDGTVGAISVKIRRIRAVRR